MIERNPLNQLADADHPGIAFLSVNTWTRARRPRDAVLDHHQSPAFRHVDGRPRLRPDDEVTGIARGMAPASPPQTSCGHPLSGPQDRSERKQGCMADTRRHCTEVQSSTKEPTMNSRYLPFIGRVLIGLPFAMSGLGKLAAYGPTTAMIAPSDFRSRHSRSRWP
jgi:hypothetical protein